MISILDYHLVSYTSFFLFLVFFAYISHFSFSLYIHRYLCHRQMEISPYFQHFLRFIIYISSPLWSKRLIPVFVAKHRIHHKYSDTEKDPSHPKYGFWFLLTKGNSPTKEQLIKYGEFMLEPKDQLTKFYKKYPWGGISILIFIFTLTMGITGFLIGILWVPVQAIYREGTDYCYHTIGYINNQVKGQARNVTPIAFVEGLHSNHHTRPWDPNCAHKWFEIDLFYLVLRILHFIKAIRLKKLDKDTQYEKKFDI